MSKCYGHVGVHAEARIVPVSYAVLEGREGEKPCRLVVIVRADVRITFRQKFREVEVVEAVGLLSYSEGT